MTLTAHPCNGSQAIYREAGGAYRRGYLVGWVREYARGEWRFDPEPQLHFTGEELAWLGELCESLNGEKEMK